MGWVRSETYLKQFPDQILSQGFTLPHELTLRETANGLRVFFTPVKEVEQLRGDVLADGKNLTAAQAETLLQACNGELSEVLIEYAGFGRNSLQINGVDATFSGQTARIFTDRTVTELYINDGLGYDVRKRPEPKLESTQTQLKAGEGVIVRSLKIFRLNSIWRTDPKQK